MGFGNGLKLVCEWMSVSNDEYVDGLIGAY